ncbi:helix-turn-helix transcriptional regulator [Natronorubrum halophilum]|uniref:helix-turn-helix transcriptional regulator n=1 Tax=Natronorubrum halophilum TaxID=1702106 RepID=UPI000EF6D8A1|nr:helix-turn-helix domain-containing protein [Natronorubrum halophilum]
MMPMTTESPLDDVEFLARSEHRVAVLEALAESPRSRADLQDLTEASRSTIGRVLGAFEERRWITKDEYEYEVTPLGAFVASGMRELIERIETERKLRDVWQWLPSEASGFSIEMGSEAVVTDAEADDPYRPVNRFLSLLRETDRFRFVGFDVALLEPCKNELRRRILNGMHTEIIDPPNVAKYILSTYPDHCSPPLESDNLTVWLHDDLPSYGVSLFDERIGISCYNPANGTVQVLIDTDTAEAREWAEWTYETYRQEARPLALETPVE